ncbi:MAG: sigma-54-dependent Fis family transcriptional regulator, partial [Myxococcaceae bacterium]|nr:sigma-54-dependent Fis family transcriptional regulator [Myxococcaceae bacterium]
VAASPTTVFLRGEHGSGKRRFARFIHEHSKVAARPFIEINPTTFDPVQVEVQLQAAGTVLFDEIGALSQAHQAHLLRLLEAPHAARVIASTSEAADKLLESGRLRSDLFYRLDVYPLRVPSLRERRDDLARLAQVLLMKAAQRLGRPAPTLSAGALAALEQADFPGNVRELENVLERGLIRSRTPTIEPGSLALAPPRVDAGSFPEGLPLDLAALERLAITEALRRVKGNRTHAARLLGIGLRTLRQKLNGPAAREPHASLEPSAHVEGAAS